MLPLDSAVRLLLALIVTPFASSVSGAVVKSAAKAAPVVLANKVQARRPESNVFFIRKSSSVFV